MIIHDRVSRTEQKPYVGAQTFKPDESHLFFGREREAFDLLSLVISDRLVLFYAQSGAGKSSLINTRLIPGLYKDGEFRTLPVGRLLRDEVRAENVKNIYIHNLLTSLSKFETEESRLAELSLSNYLEHLNIYDRSSEDDHFIYSEKANGNIFTVDDTESIKYVLIIDQFEELFTTYEGDWEKRSDFFSQIAAAMNQFPRLWVVLVMREDYIANLDPYVHLLPGMLRTRYYMQRLSTDQALKAVEEPVKVFNREYVGGAAELIVNALSQVNVRGPNNEELKLPGQYVEPVQLQVVCSSLWEKVKDKEGVIDQKVVAEHVENINEALGNFYAEQVAAIAGDQTAQEREIRGWFERELIIDGKRRNMVAQQPGGKSGGLDDEVVRMFLGSLIREEKRSGGATFYELTHDRMVEPIIENNRKWELDNSSYFHGQVMAWMESEGNEIHLLSGGALNEAEKWADENPTKVTKPDHDFLVAGRKKQEKEEIEKKKESDKIRDKQRLVITIVSILATVVLAGLAVFGFGQAATAQVANTQAADSLATAQAANTQAAQNLAAAQTAEADANTQAQIAGAGALALQAQQLITEDFQLALLLGIEAFQKYDTSQTRDALLGVTNTNPYLLQFLAGHKGIVSSVVSSPDGKMLASSSFDNTIILWDVNNPSDPSQLATLEGHTNFVTSVAFSPDGKTLASGSYDNTIILWDVETRQPIGQPFEGHSVFVYSVAFSPDGKTLASGNADGTIVLWDISDPSAPSQVATLEGHSDAVKGVAFSPDGKTLASGSNDGTIILWDVATQQLIGQPLTGHADFVTSMDFSPDGKILASGSFDNTIILWDVAKLQPIGQPLMGHTDVVYSVAFSPDGKTLASGSFDNTIILWDVSDPLAPSQVATLEGHSDAVYSVAFSPDGKTLASGSSDNTIIFWDVSSNLSDPVQVATLEGHTDVVYSVAFSPDGKTLASGSDDNTIILWDVSDPSVPIQLPTLEGHSDAVYSVAFSPDGKTLASGNADGTIVLWDVSDPSVPIQLPTLEGHSDAVSSVAFSPDGKTLASGISDNTIILWDVATLQPIGQPLMGHTDVVYSVAFSQDGKTLASGSFDNTIILWDVAAHQPIGLPLMGHTDFVTSVAFSKDDKNKILASGSADGTIILWDVRNPSDPIQLTTLAKHTDVVYSVAFDSDGKTLASGSFDGTIILWDVATQQPVSQPLTGNTNLVTGIVFSPDGKTLASGGFDGTIILWDVDPRSWMERSCERAGRNFTQNEWKRYFPLEQYRKTCDQWSLEPDLTVTVTPTMTQISETTATMTITTTPVSATATMVPSSNIATPTSTPVLYQVTNVTGLDTLNIRSGPGTTYEVIGKIPQGVTSIQVTGSGVQADNTVWVPIIYIDDSGNNISGWVNSFYIKPVSTVTNVP